MNAKEKGGKKMKPQDLTRIALMTAILCILAPISIPLPVSSVALTLATFAIYLTAYILKPKQALAIPAATRTPTKPSSKFQSLNRAEQSVTVKLTVWGNSSSKERTTASLAAGSDRMNCMAYSSPKRAKCGSTSRNGKSISL